MPRKQQNESSNQLQCKPLDYLMKIYKMATWIEEKNHTVQTNYMLPTRD